MLARACVKGAGKFTPTGGKIEAFGQYTFIKDKSTMVYKLQIGGKREGDKKPMIVSGKGQFVNGTGRYEGIQGDITMNGKHLTPYSEEKGTLGDMVINFSANYTLPTK